MRKTLLYKIIDQNPLKVKFNGISFLDIQAFLKEMKINKEYIWIYQEIPFYNEKYALNQLQSFHFVRKRMKGFDTGNDCLLVVWNKDHEIFNCSCQEILYENKFANKEEIPFHAWFYDVDWQVDLVFNNPSWFDKFMQYIQNEKVELKEVEELPF